MSKSSFEDAYDRLIARIFGPMTLIAIGWLCIVGTLVCWPLSHFTFASEEPPTVLAISWVAILLTGVGIVAAADAGHRADKGNE